MRRIKELEAELQSEEKALAGLKAQTAGLEAKATALQQKIDGAGGSPPPWLPLFVCVFTSFLMIKEDHCPPDIMTQ